MINNNPLISIIISFCNPRFEYFKDAIESVLAQSHTNWEAIIVNDGSNQKSKVFLDEYIKSLNDKRFFIFNLEKNSGVSVAKNKGVEFAKGEIITFLDSDDMHLPWHYEEIIKNFSLNPECSILAIPQFYYLPILKKKIILLPPNFTSILEGQNVLSFILEKSLGSKLALICTPILALKKQVFNYVKYDPVLYAGEDFDLCLQILNNKDLSKNIEIMSIPGYLYRIYFSNSRLTQRMDLLSDSKCKITNKYNDKNSLPYELLQYMQIFDEWKFCKELAEYSKDRSVFMYLKTVSKNFNSPKDKIKSVRALINSIMKYKVLTKLFRIDFVHIKRVLFNKKKRDNTNEIKKRFKNYLSSSKDEKTGFYATRIYQRTFVN